MDQAFARVKNGFLDKKCISVTDDTAVHRPYVFVTRTKRGKKAAIRNGTPLFLPKEIGIYCETLTKNMRKQQNTTKSDWKILG